MPDILTSEPVRRCARADAAEAGWRLDRFLAAKFPELSRARLQALIASGRVSSGRETIKDANYRIKSAQDFELTIPPPVAAEPIGQAIPLKVVYEDEYLIVIDKQAGLVVHPAAGNPDGTLVNALIAHCGESLKGVGGVARPGIVHRLDKDTTGLLVAAKTEKVMTSLAKQFAAHAIERAYHAVVWGAPRQAEGRIEGLIGRNPFDRKRMGVVRGGGKEARTRYCTLERFGPSSQPFAALVECRLETGRTHQIRVHLTHLGHPLIGDPTYGRARGAPRGRNDAQIAAYGAAAGFARQALHARLLGFHHPILNRTLRFESDWPADFAGLIESLRLLNGP
ncbi:MAG: RluA family pseudouridine synthase [Rhizomicrobium sp.]